MLHILAQRFPFPPRRGDQLAVSKMVEFCEKFSIEYTVWTPPRFKGNQVMVGANFQGNFKTLSFSFLNFFFLIFANPLMPFQTRLFSFFKLPPSDVSDADIVYVHTVRMIGPSYFLKSEVHLGAQIDLSAEFRERSKGKIFLISWVYLLEAWLLSRQKRIFFAKYSSIFRVTANEFKDLETLASEKINLITSPHGFDAARISPRKRKESGKKLQVGFWGNMDFLPNKLAVKELFLWFKNTDFPCELVIFGIHSQGMDLPEGVRCLGEISDIDMAIRDVDVLINLVSIGGGFQNKTIEAWAQNVPVIGFWQAFRGLPQVGSLPIIINEIDDIDATLQNLPVVAKGVDYSIWVRKNWNQETEIRDRFAAMGY